MNLSSGNTLNGLRSEVRKVAEPQKVPDYMRFFKTGVGEYGEGDIFMGLTVPKSRKIAKMYKNLSINDTEKLLHSKIHEERLIALLILVDKYSTADNNLQKEIFDLYLSNTRFVNNWDLVDLSAPKIVGKHLLDRNKKLLYRLAQSKLLWEKRIAVIATLYFISNNHFDTTLEISELLLDDKHDLIHKAVGWALREVGKKNQLVEEKFLKKYYQKMPRTMLRYSIERFPENLRLAYLKGKIK